QRITRILDEFSQDTSACRVHNADRSSRTNSCKDIRNDCPIAQPASEPVAMGMSLSLAGRVAIDDLKTRSAVSNFHHVVIRAERNGQAARLRSRRWDCNDVGRGLSYGYAVQDATLCAVDFVDPLTEPVAIVYCVQSEVSPHVMWVVPHPACAPTVDLSLNPE